jgi:AraC-like DNA-binding protein
MSPDRLRALREKPKNLPRWNGSVLEVATIQPAKPKLHYIKDPTDFVSSESVLSSKGSSLEGVNIEVSRVLGVIQHANLDYLQPTIILPLTRKGYVSHRHNGVFREYFFHPSRQGTASTIGIFTPGFLHDCRPEIEAEYCEIQLTPQLLVEKAQEFDIAVNHFGVEVRPVMAKQDLQLEYLCRSMIIELQEGGVSGRLYFDHLVSLLAFRILKHYSTVSVNSAAVPLAGMNHRIKRSLELIHDCFQKDLTLKDIASAANMSPYHFSRTFKLATGCTPHQYVLRWRVQKAEQLLLQTDLKISDIATATGFSNINQLSKVFRKLSNKSPSEYRRAPD